eukprot:11174306-Lingulodinium_polyedra.AAC.1
MPGARGAPTRRARRVARIQYEILKSLVAVASERFMDKSHVDDCGGNGNHDHTKHAIRAANGEEKDGE